MIYRYTCFLFLIIFASGCYTVYEHPDVTVTENGETYLAKIMFFDNCSDCHSTEEVTEYYYLANDQIISPHKLNDEKFYRISKQGNFDYFYNSVWWFEMDYEYYYPEDEYTQLQEDILKDRQIDTTSIKNIESNE